MASRLVTTLVGTSDQSLQRKPGTPGEVASGPVGTEAQPVAPASLAALYDSYADFVYRTLVGLGVAPARAEDAMQDVFVIANQHLATFQGTFHKAWLFRIAHCVARNVRRSVRRAAGEPIEGMQLVDASSSPFDGAVHTEQIRLLGHLLDQLKKQQREVFVLAELEQLAHVEIAEALGIHVNTVANRLNAARSHLERLLRKHQQDIGSLTRNA